MAHSTNRTVLYFNKLFSGCPRDVVPLGTVNLTWLFPDQSFSAWQIGMCDSEQLVVTWHYLICSMKHRGGWRTLPLPPSASVGRGGINKSHEIATQRAQQWVTEWLDWFSFKVRHRTPLHQNTDENGLTVYYSQLKKTVSSHHMFNLK